MDPKITSHPIEAALADAQHGVVARRQLTARGLTETMVRNRIRDGRLIRLHRGVYALGHRRLRQEGWWLAAVLATGDRAVLSHRDAAALHGIRAPSNSAKVDVTTPDRVAATPAIRVHRVTTLTPADTTTINAIPVTTVARTLVDLASTLSPKAISEAERVHLIDVVAIEEARLRVRGRRGQGDAALQQALDDHRSRGASLTRSELEDRFLAVVEANGLPRPRTNATIHGHEVDALWADHRLVVELDGWAFHHTRAAFQRDRTKSNALELLGYAVLRYTHDDVARRAERMVAELRGLLTT